ncbi:hypothetical protein DFH28DRAFT_423301 [Melampsora americana]|nr:hypothetical protein DFH28DRAFT_423301 [Melampsora americana]
MIIRNLNTYRHLISSSSTTTSTTSTTSHLNFSSTTIKFKTSSNFPFPKHPFPTPFEIFHLPRSASKSEIKSRYYQLVKSFHPDLQSNLTTHPHQDQSNSTDQFKLIIKAYELLKSNSKRQSYLHSGEGWPRSSDSFNRASRHSQRSTSSTSSSTHRSYRPFYPSSLWDWSSSNPRDHRYPSTEDDHWFSSTRSNDSSTFKEQWQRDGLLTKNGILISSLGFLALMVYSFQTWRVMPFLDSQTYQSSSSTSNQSSSSTSNQSFIEPSGDQRLDKEAWDQIPSSTSTLPSISSHQLTHQSLNHSSSLSIEDPGSYSNLLTTTSYMELINRRSQNAAKDLKAARAAAISPSHLTLTPAKSITPKLVSSHTTTS